LRLAVCVATVLVGWSALVVAAPRHAPAPAPAWKTLPMPDAMPAAATEADLTVGDVKVHYAIYGKGTPVILLHGGAGNGEQFANQLPALIDHYQVIVVDSRGHGRSTRSRHGLGYHQMADDVLALMDHLTLPRAAFVGWSDGGVIALDLAITHPDRVARIFTFGANYESSGMKPAGKSATFDGYFKKCRDDYARLSPTPREYGAFLKDLRKMWSTQPAYTKAQLRAIKVPATIADGEYDEIIRRAHTEELARLIPGAHLVILPGVSHFAMWQDAKAFNAAMLDFLAAP
jgi:pimeloyl-ACP methyl ester carboxylesterase